MDLVRSIAIRADDWTHDIRAAREQISFSKGTTVVCDRGYVDYSWLNEINQNGVWFVTRTKTNMIFKVVESKPTNRTQTND